MSVRRTTKVSPMNCSWWHHIPCEHNNLISPTRPYPLWSCNGNGHVKDSGRIWDCSAMLVWTAIHFFSKVVHSEPCFMAISHSILACHWWHEHSTNSQHACINLLKLLRGLGSLYVACSSDHYHRGLLLLCFIERQMIQQICSKINNALIVEHFLLYMWCGSFKCTKSASKCTDKWSSYP